MIRRMMILAVLTFQVLLAPVYSQEIWVGKDGNIRNVDTRAVLIDGGAIYLATRNEVYKSKDMNGRWESIFALPSGSNEISCIAGRGKNVFIGTRRGLFRSKDFGRSWRNVFRTITPEKNDVTYIETSRHNLDMLLIGTKKGIFISEDSGGSWQDISANLKNIFVKCIALNKESIYAGTDSGLYLRGGDSLGWERVIVASPVEKSGEEMASDSEGLEEPEQGSAINCIAISGTRLYIGMDRRILYSENGVNSWNTLPSDGISGIVNYILPSLKKEKLYCATTKGVFELSKDNSRWLELYSGLSRTINVSKLIFEDEEENILWALTDKGLYKLESAKYAAEQYVDIEKSLKTIKLVIDNEPTFQELQQAAIRFAEVSPEKIRNWRQEARMKAFLPKVSFGIDNDRSTDSEIYTSATKDYIIVGPDNVSKSWDVSVSWQLGDLIWSDDQTNIDVRSRLMVQLRNDILDDLRRAYYERKKVQFELMTEPPRNLKLKFEKELRLKELTSQIDDLTGNYLSDRIKALE